MQRRCHRVLPLPSLYDSGEQLNLSFQFKLFPHQFSGHVLEFSLSGVPKSQIGNVTPTSMNMNLIVHWL